MGTSAFGTTAVLWENGRATNLGSLGGRHSVAQAINEQGQVAGTSTTPGGDRRLFLWENGTMTDLGTLGGRTTAFSNDLGTGKLNERGQVVGWSQTKTGEWHAFVWHNGTMTDLGTLAGERWSSAEAVNNRGEIVGWSSPTRDGERHAVAWTLLGG